MIPRGYNDFVPLLHPPTLRNPMEKDNQDDPFADEQKPARRTGPGLLVPLVIVAVVGGLWFLWSATPAATEIRYSFFLEQLKAKNVLEVRLYSDRAVGRFKVPPELPTLADSAGDKDKAKPGGAAVPAAKPQQAKEHFTVH